MRRYSQSDIEFHKQTQIVGFCPRPKRRIDWKCVNGTCDAMRCFQFIHSHKSAPEYVNAFN